MQEQEENIQFDNMPNFGKMFSEKATNWDDDKEYDSLYDELCDKCRPDKFIDDSNNKLFVFANQLYGELKSKKGANDNELIGIRDRAMDSLGIHISTKKLYESLYHYLNPQVYTTLEPYDAERVAQAGEYYIRMRECKDDIHALEKLRSDASTFIAKRVAEEEEEENETSTLIIIGLIAVVIAMAAIAIVSSNN